MFSSYYMDQHGHVYPNKVNQDDVRVAVIAFEDREQVERLAVIIAKSGAHRGRVARSAETNALQAALREFADPTPDAVSARTTQPDESLPVGTQVLAWPGSRDGRAMLTRTRTPVWRLNGGDPVVSVEGYAGGIALTHIEVMPS